MPETKYGKYIIREPLEKGRAGPSMHICAEDACPGSKFPNFPAECQLLYMTEPRTMIPEPHAHDCDELFFIFGSNPKNIYEFDAEIEMYFGKEQEKHIINTTSIIYLPKGVIHCPVIIKKVNKPFMWMHVLFSTKYTMSVGDISLHPAHSSREHYSPAEAAKLRRGIPLGK